MRGRPVDSKAYVESTTGLLSESIYNRLKHRAKAILRRETAGYRFEPTDLVHEAYLRMARSEVALCFRDDAHLLALTTIVMRRILIDYHRSGDSPRRCPQVPLDDQLALWIDPASDAVSVNQILERLYLADAQLYRVVQMRLFLGLDLDEIASVLSVSSRTVRRHWSLAQAWLRSALRPAKVQSSAPACTSRRNEYQPRPRSSSGSCCVGA